MTKNDFYEGACNRLILECEKIAKFYSEFMAVECLDETTGITPVFDSLMQAQIERGIFSAAAYELFGQYIEVFMASKGMWSNSTKVPRVEIASDKPKNVYDELSKWKPPLPQRSPEPDPCSIGSIGSRGLRSGGC